MILARGHLRLRSVGSTMRPRVASHRRVAGRAGMPLPVLSGSTRGRSWLAADKPKEQTQRDSGRDVRCSGRLLAEPVECGLPDGLNDRRSVTEEDVHSDEDPTEKSTGDAAPATGSRLPSPGPSKWASDLVKKYAAKSRRKRETEDE